MMRLQIFAVVGFLAFPLNAIAARPVVGNPDEGKIMYQECEGCHSMRENLIGPMHCGVVGRRAGTVPGYVYSEAMKNSGLTWDIKTLDKFLKSPLSFLPDANMGYVGISDDQDRADLIAYLKREGSDPAVCENTFAPKAAK